MAKKIRNISQLKRALNNVMFVSLNKMADEVKKQIYDFIKYYYNEYTPEFYERTYKFLNSLVKTPVYKDGDTWKVMIYIDTSIQYYNGWTVLGTSEAANRGWHGWPPHLGMSGGIHFWDEAKTVVLSPDFMSQFAKFLKHNGLNVKIK